RVCTGGRMQFVDKYCVRTPGRMRSTNEKRVCIGERMRAAPGSRMCTGGRMRGTPENRGCNGFRGDLPVEDGWVRGGLGRRWRRRAAGEQQMKKGGESGGGWGLRGKCACVRGGGCEVRRKIVRAPGAEAIYMCRTRVYAGDGSVDGAGGFEGIIDFGGGFLES